MKEVSKNYKGTKIILNPLTGNWFLFFNKEKNPGQAPYAGSLSTMKRIVDRSIKLGRQDDFVMEANSGN